MTELAIRFDGVGKRYEIGERPRYRALRDVLTNALYLPARFALSAFRQSPRAVSSERPTIWALRDVSFDIRRGEITGIIGRNGAGKSTLLRILSRITQPTVGEAVVCGRVGSLLEVGTGFHPELTGRENVFLNGAILGMRAAEIRKKFDEIVAFSEIERFIDTPVKHYSSGMYMRLAFAVAAHLETEILAVDEVLAVGDAQFQKKCLNKMGEVTSIGRTVLFVSHNMNAVEQLCGRVLLLETGLLTEDSGKVREVITKYLSAGVGELRGAIWTSQGAMPESPYFRPIRMAIVDGEGQLVRSPVRNDAENWVEIEGEIDHPDPALTVGYGLFDERGQLLYWTCQTDQAESEWPLLGRGVVRIRSRFPNHLLNEGRYRLELLASLHYRSWLFEPGSGSPYVDITIQGGLSQSPYWMAKRPGLLAPLIMWERTG